MKVDINPLIEDRENVEENGIDVTVRLADMGRVHKEDIVLGKGLKRADRDFLDVFVN